MKKNAKTTVKKVVKVAASPLRNNQELASNPPVVKEPIATEVSRAAIAKRAFEIWLQNACRHGHDVSDWLEAEQQLNG